MKSSIDRVGRTRSPLSAALLALCLGGCAAVAPGFQPEGGKKSPLLERAKAFEAGEVADNGTYAPSENEKALDCRRLLGSMKVIISRLRDSQSRPLPSVVSSAAQQVGQSMGAKSIDMSVEEKREKARLVAYNRLLKDKQCATLDIEQELRGAAASTAPSSTSATKTK